MLYGCQIWGADFITADLAKTLKNPFSQLQLSFLRFVTGASKSVDKQVLLTDCGQLPLPCLWAHILGRFWNNLSKSNNGTISQTVLKANLLLAMSGCVSCWSSKVLSICQHVDPAQLDGVDNLELMHLQSKRLASSMLNKLYPSADNLLDPRTAPSKGVALCIYNAWFRTDITEGLPAHISCQNIPESQHKLLMRFRLGCGHVATNTGRHCSPKDKVPRGQRLCAIPGCDEVEDEKHVIFECKAYDCLRSSSVFKPLFQTNVACCMRVFMNNLDQLIVAQFLNELFKIRYKVLRNN